MAKNVTKKPLGIPREGRGTKKSLNQLLLDSENPRFGLLNKSSDQAEILDHIVENFGVDDVLSSLAVNGYFEAEPLVCREKEGTDQAIVKEGNRRLAACLILKGDDRAKKHKQRIKHFQTMWKKHKGPTIDPVPVILFKAHELEKEILFYLGVRHIAATQDWDSYAKAAWVAQVVENTGRSVSEIAEMIGDQYKTVNRLLQGQYFVKQLIETNLFFPKHSVRKGRGSVTEYPFSWVYTILDYRAVGDFLNISEEITTANPLKTEESLKRGSLLLTAMFGDSSKGRNSAIQDSRDLGDLASLFADEEKVALLEKGRSLSEIQFRTQPLEQSLREGLISIREILESLLIKLTSNDLSKEKAQNFIPQSEGNKKLLSELDKKIKEAAFGSIDE